MRIGGGCNAKGLGWEKEWCFDANCVFESPFSALENSSCSGGEKEGERSPWKPGVLGADWLRSWAR